MFYVYIGIEFEIVINYLGVNVVKFGYVWVMIEVMVGDVD